MIESVKKSIINEVHWENGLTYKEYKELIGKLLAINQTTGENHSENMIEYTQLNQKRMAKWDKISKISDALHDELNKISHKQYWLVLTEAWCGDAAQNIPTINKLAGINPKVELRLLLRDENLDIMDAYLTNGGRSIPKLIILNQAFEELGTWGPRPLPVQSKLEEFKSGHISKEAFNQSIHTWYGKDRTATLQNELLSLIKSINQA